MSYEYHVVPAPRVAPRIKGVRSAPERFAMAVAEVMNEAAAEGWEYLRADTLPMEARTGWFGGRTVAPQELLVFRRPAEGGQATPRIPPLSRDALPEREPAGVTPIARTPSPRARASPFDPSRAEIEPQIAVAAPRPSAERDGATGPHRPRLGGARRD